MNFGGQADGAASSRVAPFILLTASAVLSACGSSAEGQPSATAELSSALETSPISLSAALLDTPSAPIGGEACPFLSTETAIATIKTSMAFALREASDTRCVWNYNVGFEIKVTVEPATDAKPIEKRLYNLDNPPLIKVQSGPGTGATIAYDTTWKERPPRPYAFGFTLGSDYIFIRTTGVATSEEQLRRAADEIARMLPDASKVATGGAPDPTPAGFQACDIWSIETLKRVFAVDERGNVSSSPINNKTCTFTIFPSRNRADGITLDFNFWKPPAGDYEARKASGWTPVELGGKQALLLEKEDQFGLATQYVAPMENGNFGLTVLSKDPAMKATATLLAENALSRISD